GGKLMVPMFAKAMDTIAEEMEEEGDFDLWVDQWQQTLHVNLLAAAVLCRELVPHFVQHGGGRMVHISSRAAFRGDTTAYMAYAASKGGMVSLSRSIARGYGKQGIKSFVVAPGFIQTDMAQQFIDVYGEQFVLDDLALDTLTQPKDLAPTVIFLLSGWMDHATGCTIDVNAGSYVH
ncbi:MAG: SDR family oxidoreductase, partial [Bacteroidota bacterium]